MLLAREAVPQGLAFDERHDVIEESIGFTGVVERQDVGMREPRRDLDLPKKPIGAERRGDLGFENLDGYLAVVLEVLCEVDRRHPPAPEFTLDAVAVGHADPEALKLGNHLSCRCRRAQLQYRQLRGVTRGSRCARCRAAHALECWSRPNLYLDCTAP